MHILTSGEEQFENEGNAHKTKLLHVFCVWYYIPPVLQVNTSDISGDIYMSEKTKT